MNFYKSYIKEHSGVSFLSLTVWLSGIVAGIYFAFDADNIAAGNVDEYIQSIISAKNEYFEVFKNGFLTNSRYSLFLCLSGSFIIFVPITLSLIAFKGFSAGYTSSFIIRLYGIKGVAATLTGVVLPLCISLPVLFMMYISSLDFPVKTFRLRRNITSLDRWKMYLMYIAKMFILFLVLNIITAFEALLTPRFFDVLLQ